MSLEIDFFSFQGESSPETLSDRRDIQGVMSKINPELLKTAIASASANTNSVANKPVYDQNCGGASVAATVTPMTIFFNGTVSVFDVTPNQAETIMKLAESNQNQTMGRVLRNNLPMSRKRSLRRFLEKRKERHVCLTPYAHSEESTSSH